MKLWILKPLSVADNMPWSPWYDKAFGFIVRASNLQAARMFASINHGDEGKEAWLDCKLSSCKELPIDGEPGMILRDFNAA